MGADKYSPRRSRAFYYFNKDMHDAEALFEYIKYGVFIRGNFEVEGPYRLKPTAHQVSQVGEKGRFGVSLRLEPIDTTEDFCKHKHRVEMYAKSQLLTTLFVIFEYFINNIYDDLISLSRATNGLVGHDLRLIWSEDDRKSFLTMPTVEAYLQDKASWMMKTHHWDRQKDRLRDLSGYFSSSHESIVGTHYYLEGRTLKNSQFTWRDFANAREVRHRISHSSGRSSMFTSHIVAEVGDLDQILLATRSWMSSFVNTISSGMYNRPILSDARAGQGIVYQYIDKAEAIHPTFKESR